MWEPPFHSPKIHSWLSWEGGREPSHKEAGNSSVYPQDGLTRVIRVPWGHTHAQQGTFLWSSSLPPHKDLTFGQKSQQRQSSQTKQLWSSRAKTAEGTFRTGRPESQSALHFFCHQRPENWRATGEQRSWRPGPHVVSITVGLGCRSDLPARCGAGMEQWRRGAERSSPGPARKRPPHFSFTQEPGCGRQNQA